MNIPAFLESLRADVYSEPISQGHSHVTNQIAPQVMAHLPKGSYILDIGCGRGPALEWFANNGHIAKGISLCLEDLTHCRESGYNVELCDMHDLPKSEVLFDCVWARHVLEHSPIPLLALSEINRVLRVGGILYVEVPAPGTACNHVANKNHYSVFTRDAWEALIQRSGFDLIESMDIHLETQAGPDVYHSIIARKAP